MRRCATQRNSTAFGGPPNHLNVLHLLPRTATLVGIFLALLVGTPLGAELESVTAAFEPVSFVADKGAQTAEGALLLKNKTSGPLSVRVTPGAILFNGATAQGVVQIGSAGGRNYADVTLAMGGDETENWARLPVRISQLLRLGTYQTSVQLSWTQDGKANTRTVPVSVVRPVPDFGVSVRGLTGAPDTIEFAPISPSDLTFSFTVDNAVGGRDLDLIIETVKAPASAKGSIEIAFEPTSFHLIAGGQRTVTGTLPFLASSAPAAGRLRIADVGIPGVQKEIPISIKPGFRTWQEIGLLALMVLVGALISIVASIVLPAIVRKKSSSDRLRDLRIQINNVLEAGSPAYLALLTEQRRAEDANEQVWPIGLRTAEALDAVKKLTDQLEEGIKLASEIGSFRGYVTDMKKFPLSLRSRILRSLDYADTFIVAGEREKVKEKFKTAQTDAKNADDLSQVRSSVESYIQKLPTNDEHESADSWIRGLVSQLKALDVAKLDKLDDLIDADMKCYTAYLYVRKFEIEVLEKNSAFQSEGASLLEDLKGGLPGIQRAAIRVESMSLNVLPADLDTALQQKLATVNSRPDNVSTGQLVTFSLNFIDPGRPGMDTAPIVRQLRYQWDFGDSTATAQGKTVVHYYKMSNFKRLKRMFSNAPDIVTGKVKVTPIAGEPVDVDFKVSVRHRPFPFQLPLLEALTFGFPLTLAILLAVSSHSGETLTFATLNDYVNPFLWGFGLDQIKQQATRLQS